MSSPIEEVLERSWRGGISLQGDFARKRMATIALCASSQLITTKEKTGTFGRTWWITSKGQRYLNETKEHMA